MDSVEIRTEIKEIIGRVAGLDPAGIDDGATLREGLDLDSLSLLEISVDVDLAFGLDLPDERYKEIDSLPAMVALVEARRRELADQGQSGQDQTGQDRTGQDRSGHPEAATG